MTSNDVVKFAIVLEEADEFDTAADVISYLKRPSNWSDEFDWWKANGTPRPGDDEWSDFEQMLEEREDE